MNVSFHHIELPFALKCQAFDRESPSHIPEHTTPEQCFAPVCLVSFACLLAGGFTAQCLWAALLVMIASPVLCNSV